MKLNKNLRKFCPKSDASYAINYLLTLLNVIVVRTSSVGDVLNVISLKNNKNLLILDRELPTKGSWHVWNVLNIINGTGLKLMIKNQNN